MSATHLFESIRLADGQMELLPYHQERVNRSRRAVFGKSPVLRLANYLEQVELPQRGIYKVRVRYSVRATQHEVVPYEIRPVRKVRLVPADQVRYLRKYVDRSGIEACFNQRGDCDDVLMTQGGLITDCSYANVALFDGQHWYTPAWPLLPGTRRASLIEAGVLRPSLIRQRDLGNFRTMRLVNAMMEWEEGPELTVADILLPGATTG